MLDKRTLKFLGIIAKICADGSYKIIEKSFLATELNPKKADIESLDQMIRFLQDNEMIDVKYSDETVYCVSVLPKGRVANETGRKRGRSGFKIGNRNLLILVAAVFVASFLGALIGTIVGGAI